jgi:hypothetical protein
MKFNLDTAMKAWDAAVVWVFPRLLEGVICAEVIIFASERSGLAATEVIGCANLAVCYVWQLAWVDRVFFDRGLWKWMYRNFAMPYNTMELAARPQTMLLSCFSQMDYGHFAGNYAALATFGELLRVDGQSLISVLGVRQFSYYYLSSIYFSGGFDVLVYRPLYAYARSKV